MPFEAFGLTEPILRAVAGAGYSEPTPIQSQAIPPLMEGRDLLGCAQTGTGKTAAFALPLLHRLSCAAVPSQRPIRVLVLSPTRELASQIGESFQEYGKFTRIRHTVIFGGVGQFPQTKALSKGVDIVVATPGRLLDLMEQGYVDLSEVETFVLDEADRMLDMGFLPDLKRISAELPDQRQTVLFSATIPAPIEQLAASLLKNPVQVRIAPVKATTDLIEQWVSFVPQPHKSRALIGLLGGRDVKRALVFTRTKHGADRIVKHLERAGIRAEALHSNKTQASRLRSLENFRTNRTPILVATDIAARGIDVDGISHVVNFDLPNESETYVHRIGRTGRAGASGVALSFCDAAERKYLKDIERLLRKPIPVRTIELPADVPLPNPDITRKPEIRVNEKSPAHKPPSHARRPHAAGPAVPRGKRRTGPRGRRR